jgi:predicted KAP-like P-loop ATPase
LARQFLEWLQDYTRDEIEIAEIPPIISALLDVGDRLMRDEDRTQSLFDFGNEIRIGRVIHQLSQRLEPGKRFSTLMEAVQSGGALATITGQIISWGQEHGKYGSKADPPEIMRTVTADQLKQLEDSTLAKIRRAADDGSLVGHVRMPQILHVWKDMVGEGEVRSWVKELFQGSEIDTLIPFIAAFASMTYSQSAGDLLVRKRLRLDPKWLEAFVDASAMPAIVERLRRWVELEKAGNVRIDSGHRAAIQQFLVEWDMRQTGNDPDAFWAFDTC